MFQTKVENDVTVRKIILKSQLNKDKKCKVYIESLRIDKEGKKEYVRLSTDVWVLPSQWDKVKQRIKGNSIEVAELNIKIDEKYNEIKQFIIVDRTNMQNSAYQNREVVENLQALNKFKPNADIKLKGLTEYFNDYIDHRKAINTPYGTLKEFKTCQNRLINYENHIGKKLRFEDINLTFSDNFNKWLISQVVTKDNITTRKYQSGTIEKTFTILRTVLNHYDQRKEELGIKLSDKFKSKSFKKGEKSVNEPHPLTRNEFEILCKHNFESKAMQTTQKRVILQICTGMRYSDLFSIKPENIQNDCIIYYPAKTVHKKDNQTIVPLNQKSKTILQELEYDSSKLKISNQKYNDSIELMFKELNTKHNDIFESYTSHNFRDTFITFLIESGEDIPTLLKMVGQSNYDVMKRYFKPTIEKSIGLMNKVSEFN